MAEVESEPFLPNTVMFTIATVGYVPFALNLHASLRRLGLGDQLLVYTPGRRLKRHLWARGVRAVYFRIQRYDKWSDYGTRGFAKIMAYKWAVASEILRAGSNVLFVDSDIVFLRNPVKHLMDVMERTGADLIMQFESPKNVYNAGFWFAKPEPVVFKLFSDMTHYLMSDKTASDDQAHFNKIVRERKAIVRMWQSVLGASNPSEEPH